MPGDTTPAAPAARTSHGKAHKSPSERRTSTRRPTSTLSAAIRRGGGRAQHAAVARLPRPQLRLTGVALARTRQVGHAAARPRVAGDSPAASYSVPEIPSFAQVALCCRSQPCRVEAGRFRATTGLESLAARAQAPCPGNTMHASQPSAAPQGGAGRVVWWFGAASRSDGIAI